MFAGQGSDILLFLPVMHRALHLGDLLTVFSIFIFHFEEFLTRFDGGRGNFGTAGGVETRVDFCSGNTPRVAIRTGSLYGEPLIQARFVQ